jgi:hypothetical protein
MAQCRGRCKTQCKSQWKIKPLALIILACATLAILVLVVLPDVDPLDTAFQRGTAPLVIHSQATFVPATAKVPASLQLVFTGAEEFQLVHGLRSLALSSGPNFLPILLHSLRR